MREIRFRAWDKHNKRMIPWSPQMFSDSSPLTMYGDDFPENDDDFILMQFTGLHDSKGNEIYEGDILRFKGEYPMNLDSWMGRRFWEKTGYVYYDDKESRFTCTEMGNQVSTSYWIACSKEVIGNIYEHPELL